MSQDERQRRFEAQTKEQFEALGRFVQSFEQMVHAIRSGLSSRLQQESPNMVHFTRMLFHHKALTASPLWELFRAFIYTDVSKLRTVQPSDAGQFHQILTEIGGVVDDLIARRNNILHGTPFIGWASTDQDDFSEITFVKWGVSKKGWRQYELPRSADDLLILVKKCENVGDAIRLLQYAASTDRDRDKIIEQARKTLSGNAEN